MNTKKLFAAVAAASIGLAGVVLVSSSARATVTETNVTTSTSQTFDDGTTATGFICEPAGLAGAKEITHLGGWRAYIASLQRSG